MSSDLEKNIQRLGAEFFSLVGDQSPSLFNKDWWTGKVLDWAMQHEQFKVHLFQFVDVLPCITTDESLLRHVEDYFGGDQELPAVLRWGIKSGGLAMAAKLIAKALRSNIETMARQFIVGQNLTEAMASIDKIRKQDFAFTVDILGEASVNEQEAARLTEAYLELLDAMAAQAKKWPTLANGKEEMDWGHAPRINISVKPTALFSQADPMDFENTVQAIHDRFVPLIRKARQIGGFVHIDMEQHEFKDITLEVYQRLRSSDEFRDFPHLGLVLQAYLKETDHDLDELLTWAKSEDLVIHVRLVKGAYWDYETIRAGQLGLEAPVYSQKPASDAAFERQAKRILENHQICRLACGSHNIRSIAAVMAMAQELGVPEEHYEFQVLFGMAGPIRTSLEKLTGKVRLYCPYGELLPGMGYLVRRLLENTANESFLRQSFVEKVDQDALLAPPLVEAEKERPVLTLAGQGPDTPFINEPFADFTKASTRAAFPAAIAKVRQELGRTCPLLINGTEVITNEKIPSRNPADPKEIIGEICLATTKEVDLAIEAAVKAEKSWKETPAPERAKVLFKAAEIFRRDMLEHAAWQVLEVGKQWNQAHADVAEAIDFLEYYGREMIRLAKGQRVALPGEENLYLYQPKGITAVIAPWNFPLAISCGMCSAALVAGNPVLYKPSGLSPVIGWQMARVFMEAGVPPGVFHFLPGRGEVMGDYLVSHPAVHMIAFTGSVEIGTRIAAKTATLQPGQHHMKKIIAEMGGKNAIIIDDDADLDLAVPQVMASAFGYQGQKCSACSRVIVLTEIYDKFVDRLLAAGRSVSIGPAEDPANFMGPVVDESAQKKIMECIRLAEEEGEILLSREVPDTGFYVPLTMVAGITPEHRTANEEIFGPVLAIMRANNFQEALEMANSTPYALTGGVFSRSPSHLELARQEFQVGNLYLNRGITGALVHRQPFGGFRLSGVGSKAGGPDYLLQFLDPVSVTENVMRRGFAPLEV